MKFLALLFLAFPLFASELLQVIGADTLHFKIDDQKIICRLAFVKTPNKRCDPTSENTQIAKQTIEKELIVSHNYKVELLSKVHNGWAFCVVHIPKRGHATLHPTLNGLILELGLGIYKEELFKDKWNIKAYKDVAKKEVRGFYKTNLEVMQCLEN